MVQHSTTHVPRTRPEEALAIHDTPYFHSSLILLSVSLLRFSRAVISALSA